MPNNSATPLQKTTNTPLSDHMKSTTLIRIAAAYGLSAVALGAFGAHALKEHLSNNDLTAIWETAVRYQIWHALALLALALLQKHYQISARIGILLTVGIAIFSGTLYGICFGGPKWLGAITPIGGLSLIFAWLHLLCSKFKPNPAKPVQASTQD